MSYRERVRKQGTGLDPARFVVARVCTDRSSPPLKAFLDDYNRTRGAALLLLSWSRRERRFPRRRACALEPSSRKTLFAKRWEKASASKDAPTAPHKTRWRSTKL